MTEMIGNFVPSSKPANINLGLGVVEPFPLAKEGEGSYAPPDGLDELCERIAKHHSVDRNQICITTGASLGLAATLSAIQPRGDVLCPRPYYPAYPGLISAFGHRVVFYDLLPENDWMPDPTQIKKLMSADVRAVLLNTPSNPTGKVIPAMVMEELVGIFARRPIKIIADEVASEFLYDGVVLPSLRDLVAPQQLIQIYSLSKAFAVPGMRIGYVISSRLTIAEVACAHWLMTLGAPLVSQIEMVKLLSSEGWTRIARIKRSLVEKRAIVGARLSKIASPDGGIFFWIPTSLRDAAPIVDWLQRREGIRVMSGDKFGAPSYLRICFGGNEDDLIRALPGIDHALKLFRVLF